MTTKSQEKQNKAAIIDEQLSRLYDFKKRLGKGAYGIVWKALDKRNNQTVAVKKIFDAFRDETDAQRTFREIVFLKAFRNHANVITLLNVHKASNNLDMYLVFEYMESDLHNIIKKGNLLKDVHKRYVMYQLINAVRFIHSGNVIHRDLKPCNILLDNKCRCKLADFGLARSVASQMNNCSPDISSNMPAVLLTDYVATRWYRAPEILVASKKYTKGIDMWSLGCILGEMIRGKPLFQGSSTVNQIEKIVASLPNITEEEIQAIGGGFGTALLNQQSQVEKGPTLDELLKEGPSDAINLTKSLLQLDPLARLTANEALDHPFVQKFRNTSDELELNIDILPPFNDDVRLSIHEYRDKVYEMAQISPYRPSQTRPSSKSSSGSTSKTRTVTRKSEVTQSVCVAPVAKRLQATKKPSSTTMANDMRTLSKNQVAPQYAKSKLVAGGGDASNLIEMGHKAGSGSSNSRDSSSMSNEKTVSKNGLINGVKKGLIKRNSSPAMDLMDGGGDKAVGLKNNSTSVMNKPPSRMSPEMLRGRSSSLDLQNRTTKLPGFVNVNNTSQNAYGEHQQYKTQTQLQAESVIFGNSSSSTVGNQNLEPNRKSNVATNNYKQDCVNVKKAYDNSSYHLTSQTQKTIKKFDNLMINRKSSVTLPGQVPVLPPPPSTTTIHKISNSNKHLNNMDIQRSNIPIISNTSNNINKNNNQNNHQTRPPNKSEHFTHHTNTNCISGKINSNHLSNLSRKADNYCYERRLKRLEEEIERYKSDVNSFCKQSFATTTTNNNSHHTNNNCIISSSNNFHDKPKIPVKQSSSSTPTKSHTNTNTNTNTNTHTQANKVSSSYTNHVRNGGNAKTKLPAVAVNTITQVQFQNQVHSHLQIASQGNNATNNHCNNDNLIGYIKSDYLYQQQQQQLQQQHQYAYEQSAAAKPSSTNYINTKHYQNSNNNNDKAHINNNNKITNNNNNNGNTNNNNNNTNNIGNSYTKSSHDYANSRFTNYTTAKITAPTAAAATTTTKQHQYLPQYHPHNTQHHSHQNADLSGSYSTANANQATTTAGTAAAAAHHFTKYPFQYHHETSATSMRPVTVSKII